MEPSSPPTVAPVSDGGTVEGKVLYRGWGTQGGQGGPWDIPSDLPPSRMKYGEVNISSTMEPHTHWHFVHYGEAVLFQSIATTCM